MHPVIDSDGNNVHILDWLMDKYYLSRTKRTIVLMVKNSQPIVGWLRIVQFGITKPGMGIQKLVEEPSERFRATYWEFAGSE